MQFVTSRELRLNPGMVWGKLEKEKALIITSNGRPMGILSDLPGNDVEAAITFLRRLKGQWALEQARKHAKERGLDQWSLNDINKVIQEVRRERRKRLNP